MKKFPEIEVKVTRIPGGFRGVAKSKLPCGAVAVGMSEKLYEVTAYAKAQIECTDTCIEHFREHKCRRV